MTTPTEHQHITEEQAEELARKLLPEMEPQLIVFCASCRHSIEAVLDGFKKSDIPEEIWIDEEDDDEDDDAFLNDLTHDKKCSLKRNAEEYEKGKKLIHLEGLNLNSLEEIIKRLKFSLSVKNAANSRLYEKKIKSLGIDSNSLKKIEERIQLTLQKKPIDTTIPKTAKEAEDFRKVGEMFKDGYPPDDPDTKIIRNEQAVQSFLEAVLGIKQVVGDEEFLAQYKQLQLTKKEVEELERALQLWEVLQEAQRCPEHQHMSDEESKDIAQKILLMMNIGDPDDYETIEDWREAFREANFNTIVIVCNECREKIFKALEEIGPPASTTEETTGFLDVDLVKLKLDRALERYAKGKKAMKQMKHLKRDELEQMLKEFNDLEVKEIAKVAEAISNKVGADLGILKEQEKTYFPTEKELDETIFIGKEAGNQIIVLRALLGKTLVIGDEAFLAEYGYIGEE